MDFDDAYANAAYIPGAAAYPERWRQNAAEFRDGLLSAGQAELDITYGQSTRSRLDLFLPDKAPWGLLIFVHGGYWLKFDKSYWSHLAAGPLHHGWAVAMPSYDLCPEVTIAQITRQIVQAVICAAGRVDGGLVLSGHSAGGHLVARMLAPGMLPNAVMQRVQRVVPISPVADLRPLLQTAMNAQFGMDAAQAAAESMSTMLPAVNAGANFILHSAGWLEGGLTMGYEKFIIDKHFSSKNYFKLSIGKKRHLKIELD